MHEVRQICLLRIEIAGSRSVVVQVAVLEAGQKPDSGLALIWGAAPERVLGAEQAILVIKQRLHFEYYLNAAAAVKQTFAACLKSQRGASLKSWIVRCIIGIGFASLLGALWIDFYSNLNSHSSIAMLEPLSIDKSNIPPTLASPTSSNRLKQYFQSSSFLLQQEEISLFIKNFPIITLKEVNGLNNLIDLLIRQNELLGAKCQQQVNLIKESYSKYEKLSTSLKQMKAEKERLERERKQSEEKFMFYKASSERDDGRKEEYETIIRKLEAEKMKAELTLKEATQLNSTYADLVKHISSGNYRRCEDFIHDSAILRQTPHVVELESYCQKERKKSKYVGRVKPCVEDFCLRLEKVIKVVSQSALQKEIKTENSQLIALIGDLLEPSSKSKPKKRRNEQSEKSIPTLSDLGNSNYRRQCGFFESMIQRLTDNAVESNTNKEEIFRDFEQLKKTLSETKSHYESLLKKLKEEVASKNKKNQADLLLKEETIKHYEEQLNKAENLLKECSEKNDTLEEEVRMLKRELEVTCLNLQEAEAKIGRVEEEALEKVDFMKRQTNMKLTEIERITNMKTEQREELIQELNERRRKEQAEHDQIITQNKKKIKALEDTVDDLNHEVKNLNRSIQDYESKCSRTDSSYKLLEADLAKCKSENSALQDREQKKTKHIQELKETLKSLDHEKSLQTAYISELESKVSTLVSKAKSTESKNKVEGSVRKEITAIKNSLAEEKERSEQYESYCLEMKDQNQRLKHIVKDMKKELEDVYVRLAALKQSESQREQYMAEMENSERVKETLVREHEDLKYEMLRLEADNKKLSLELKHYKNIVNRFDFIEESYR